MSRLVQNTSNNTRLVSQQSTSGRISIVAHNSTISNVSFGGADVVPIRRPEPTRVLKRLGVYGAIVLFCAVTWLGVYYVLSSIVLGH